MRIAIDARAVNWYRGTGIGTYTENLLRYLIFKNDTHDYQIYWSGDGYENFEKENIQISLSSKKHHRFFEQYYFPNNLDKEKIGLYHIPQNGMGFSETISCKTIVTIHDLIPYIMPETVGKGYLSKFLREMPKIMENTEAIITVSEWSKKDILEFFPMNPDKIHVTPLAADMKYKPLNKENCRIFLKDNFGIDRPFILYIGGFSPRKNVKSLILAFAELYNQLDREIDLVIVGAKKDEGNTLAELSGNLDLASHIKFTGFVEENHLPILYNGCELFVYPSLYEGFGLPPLEAMSCGAPVIASSVTSIPEVVQDCAALFDPFDTKALTEILGKYLTSPMLCNEMVEKGLRRAKDFSWAKTAEATLKVYEKILDMVEA